MDKLLSSQNRPASHYVGSAPPRRLDRTVSAPARHLSFDMVQVSVQLCGVFR